MIEWLLLSGLSKLILYLWLSKAESLPTNTWKIIHPVGLCPHPKTLAGAYPRIKHLKYDAHQERQAKTKAEQNVSLEISDKLSGESLV